MKMNNFIILLLVQLFLSECSSPSIKKTNTINYTGSIDQFNDDDIYRDFTKKLSLSSLEKDIPDSFHLRLWAYQSPFIPKYMIDVSYSNSTSRLNCKIIEPRIKITNEDSFSIVKDVKRLFDFISMADAKTMKTNIKNDSLFFSHVDSLSIETLPNQIDILSEKNKKSYINGGMTYYLQIAKKGFYKSVSYKAPEYYGQSEENNKRVLSFINFVKNSTN